MLSIQDYLHFLHKELLILKNRLKHDKKLLFPILFFSYILLTIQNGKATAVQAQNSDLSLHETLFTLFLIIILIFNTKLPLFVHSADYLIERDIKRYFKNLIINNIIVLPIAATAFYLFVIGHNYMVVFSFILWLTTCSLMSLLISVTEFSLLDFKRNQQIVLLILLFVPTIFLNYSTIINYDFSFVSIIKCIPVIGWFFSLSINNNVCQNVAFISLITFIYSAFYYLYFHQIKPQEDSSLRDKFVQRMNKKRYFNNGVQVFKKREKSLSSVTLFGNGASSLHYKNICANRSWGGSWFINLEQLLYLVIFSIFIIIAFIADPTNEADSLSTIIMLPNYILWGIIVLRDEPNIVLDCYFKMIPDLMRKKFNQLIRYNFLTILMPIIVANLTAVIFFRANVGLMLLVTLVAPSMYLVKVVEIFVLNNYLNFKNRSVNDYILLSINLVVLVAVPLILIELFELSSLTNLISGNIPIFSTEMVNISITLCYFGGIYGIFYLFFDELCQKIDFSKN